MVTWAEAVSRTDSPAGSTGTTVDAAKPFRAATAVSANPDGAAAADEIIAQLGSRDGRPPDFVTVHYGGNRAPGTVWGPLTRALPVEALHGGSSCRGVMTGTGAAIAGGDAIGAFAIWDEAGAYGSAMAPLGADPRAAAAWAVQSALSRAGRDGEAPDLIWLTAAPGHEEAVLDGIRDIVGRASPIIGGSAADNTVEGGWSVFDAAGIGRDAVVVSVMFPSVPFGFGFESGYAATGLHGRVTEAQGRSIHTIDHRPAAAVYAEWTGLRVPEAPAESATILSEAALFPLGRRVGEIEGVPIHLLSHPSVAHGDGRLDLFAVVEPGEDVWLMRGSRDSLVQRAARIADGACHQIGEAETPAGALMVYCGGCMLAVSDRMDEVALSVSQALGHVPFLGLYSFGEQGEMLAGDSRHGNLMISCIVFGGGGPIPGAPDAP